MDYMDNVQLTSEEQAIIEGHSTATDPFLNQQFQNQIMEKQHLEVLKHYTEDEHIPKDIKTSRWGIFGKGLQLTFLEEKDLPMIDMFNNILRINALTNKPAHKLTFEETNGLDQTQLYFYLQAKRAIGTNQGKVNERTLQVTQIGQQISTNTNVNANQPRRNIMGKLRQLL